MTTYLDVAVVRIGEYLTRVPKLRQLRSASAAITEATRTDSDSTVLRGLLGITVDINRSAGQADGVLHLTVIEGDAARAAQDVLAQLRTHLPGAQLTASWAEGESYPAARAAMNAGQGHSVVWLPTTNEFPVARPCGGRSRDGDQGCGQRPGAGEQGSPTPLCPDCRKRTRRGTSRAESLLDAIGTQMTELKDLPVGERPPESNHIASVAMDGNGVGALFGRLLSGKSSTHPQVVSEALSAATVRAFGAAASELATVDRAVPLIPVTLGGDDVVVIVAAVDAWPFVQSFQREFTAALQEQLGDDAAGLSMSAGIVFHQVKEPITQTIAMADELMRHAKKVEKGSMPTASWIDTTSDSADGSDEVTTRPVVTLDSLRRQGDALRTLGDVRASALSNLRWMLAELDELPLLDGDRADAVRAQAERVGALDAIRPFSYPTGDGIPLNVALDLVRWWR